MIHGFRPVTLVLLLAPLARAQLSGQVTDRGFRGLSGVGVSLVGSGSSTTTDPTGAWSMPSLQVRERSSWARPERLRWTGEALEFTLSAPAVVGLEAFALDGRTLRRSPPSRLEAGSRSVPVASASTGMVWIRLEVDGRPHVLLAGTGALRGIGAPRYEPPARASATADTIRLTWKSRVVADIPLLAPDTSGILAHIDTSSAIPWNETIPFGHLYDPRDGQVYRTVQIGGDRWMAENLNHVVDSSWWYAGLDILRPDGAGGYDSLDENPSRGTKYGRLYKWAAAMGLPDSCNWKSCATTLRPQGACPPGWHVPDDATWGRLADAAASLGKTVVDSAGHALMATVGWPASMSPPASDIAGFRALPGGQRHYTEPLGRGTTGIYDAGNYGKWWTSTQAPPLYAYARVLHATLPGVFRSEFPYKHDGYSCRCVED